MLKKLEKMKMKQKLTFGYAVVIGMMAALAVVAIVGVTFLDGKLNDYINGAQAADTAVKMCRIETNIAARNIREMALSEDSSSYGTYTEAINSNIAILEESLADLKNSGMLENELYQRYENAITGWISIGNQIIDELEAGDKETATKMIFNDCAPALQEAIAIAKEIDAVTDQEKQAAIRSSNQTVIFDAAMIIVLLVMATVLAIRIGHRIIASITVPLQQIETVAIDLSNGNLHSRLDYHSEDEIGMLAHSLRKSINTLSAYVGDIDRMMQEFSNGNFDAEPQVDWKGDFISIRDSIVHFEDKMTHTVKNIQRVADQVTSGAEQVSASSMDLANGATEQAGITEELTATIEGVSEQIHQNAANARTISQDVNTVGVEIVNSNGKMQKMVSSMEEIS